VVYEMLAGEPPHGGPTAQAILARQQMETPRSIRVLRPTLPEGVERAILTALAKPPADRFPTVSQFTTALATSAETRRRGDRWPWPRLRAVALGSAVLLGVGGLAWLSQKGAIGGSSGPIPAADATRVAVLYFEDLSEQGTLGAVAHGLTEDLIDALGQVTALHVVSPNGVRPYLRHPVSPDSIGRALRVGSLVGGSVERSEGVLRVRVRLIDASSGLQLQSRTLEYPYADLFALQSELTQEVSGFLRERLGREIRLREGRKGTQSVAAWELVQEGEGSREAARTVRVQGDAVAAERALDTADSLFARAARLDSTWPDPWVLRGWVDVDRIGPSEDTDSIGAWARDGIGHANRALALRPGYPPALELRGTLRFRNWLESGRAASELQQAEEDLRSAAGPAGAVPANSAQARTWGTLSALLQARGQLAEANLLARRAYEADAFLTESPDLLFRLYYTSLDLGRVPEAGQWCEAGEKRFPEDWRFTYCQLGLLGLSDSVRPPSHRKADIARAWELVSRLERLGPAEQRAVQLPRWHMRVAGILGQAGMADSAEAVIRRARAVASNDPEMDFHEAGARMLLGDREAALRLLARDLAANPQFKSYVRVDPIFRPLWEDPRFQAMVNSPTVRADSSGVSPQNE
jgi:TolB-like protein/tetratricopeptide (TPR) repeat protein